MTDQPPGNPPGWQPQPAPGYPAPPPPNPRGPRVWRNGLLVGLVIGLVIGAGALGLAWTLSGSDSAGETSADPAADAEAVCGIVARTPTITEDTPVDELRRWGVGEVGPSLADQDPTYEPLNEALQRAMRAMQRFDVNELREATDQVKQLCDDL